MEFVRGDTFKFKFCRKDATGETIVTKADEIFFTVKKNYKKSEYLIQKSLSKNEIEFTEDGYYHVVILPDDTKNLKYNTYVCDIQVEFDGIVHTPYLGKIKITNEVTF